ncbi:MAG: fimbrillin family protein [Bacteroidaceae bacterium]|nr:fimbrillin family protein [Bacteroidaceae bacterium]
MKKRVLPFLLLALFSAISCNNEHDIPNTENCNSVRFNAKVGKSTRATDIQFETGDEISIYASYTDSEEVGTYAQNVRYRFEDNIFITNDNLSYPKSGDDLQFNAVYPYREYIVPEFQFAVKKDQRTHSGYTESDLMTASAIGNKNGTVDLTFSHRLSKVVINIFSDNMPAGEQELTVKDVRYIADVNLLNNTCYADNDSLCNIIASSNGTNSFKVLLPPQAISQDTVFAEIRIGDKVYEWTADKNVTLNPGVEYTYNINIDEANLLSEWIPIGKAIYTEDLVTTFFDVENVTYEVEAEQSTKNPYIIRIIDPYGAAYPHNQDGDYDTTTKHYMVFNCEDPEGIYIEDFHYSGMNWGYGEFIMGSLAYYYMANNSATFEEIKASGYCGTLDENLCITFPAKSLIISMTEYNEGGFYHSNINAAFRLDLSTTTLAE